MLTKGIFALLVISSLLSLSIVIALGNEGGLETQYGMGFIGLLRKSKHYFLGLEGRMEVPITETIGILGELGVTNGIKGNTKDNDIEFIDGVFTLGFPSTKMRAYLGIGTGFYRRNERPPNAVWTKYGFYTTLVGGIKTNTFFVQGKTTTTRMNPVVSIGVLL